MSDTPGAPCCPCGREINPFLLAKYNVGLCDECIWLDRQWLLTILPNFLTSWGNDIKQAKELHEWASRRVAEFDRRSVPAASR